MILGQNLDEMGASSPAEAMLAARRVRTRLILAQQALSIRNCLRANQLTVDAMTWFQTMMQSRRAAGMQPYDNVSRELLLELSRTRHKVAARCGG